MDWLDGYYENKAVARLVIYDGTNFRDSAGNAISVSGSGESNTASNVGVGGVGVFNDKVGVDLQFRNIIAKSSKVAVTLNDPNDEVEIDVTEANLSLNNIGGTIDLGGAQASGTIAAARMPAHTGDVTSSAGNVALTISSLAVTNSKLAQAAGNTVKGRISGTLGQVGDLSIATSSMLGRGPTGNIASLSVGSGLVITDTGIGTAAITGDVSIGADGVTSTIGTGVVVNAMLAANTIGNSKFAQMQTATVKGNSTGSTGNAQDCTLTGGLTMVSGAPGSLKSKGSFAIPCTFSTTTTMDDPGAEFVRFNNATLASVTQVAISASLGGRDLAGLFTTLGNAQIGFMSNNSTSLAHAAFEVTTSDDNGTGDFFTFTVTPIPNVGVLPANNEELQMLYWPSVGSGLTTQDVLDMDVVRTNVDGQLIDAEGVVISGSPSVADYAALVALNPATYDGFAVNVQSGLNNSLWVSNGTAWGPLNGEYVQERSTGSSVQKLIVPNAAITWTASNSGGVVRLTASGVHGLTTTPAVGSQIYVTAGTGWTAGSFHTIGTVVSTTVIDLTTAFSSHGNPTVADAGDEVPVKVITLPVLRSTTAVIVEANIEFSADAGSSSRRPKFYLDATALNNFNFTSATNTSQPFRWGFRNTGATNTQRALTGENNTGYAASTLPTLTAAVDTSTAKTITIAFIPAAANCSIELVNYVVTIRG